MCCRNSSEPSLIRGSPAPKRPFVAQEVALLLDFAPLLLPLHAEGRIRQHVVERPRTAVGAALVAVLGERVAQDDVLGVLALDQHVGLADRPGLVVPVLPVEKRIRVAVVLPQVVLGDREHAAGPAGRVVDGLDLVSIAEVGLGRQQQADHQSNHLARGEVFARLLVGLLRSDADQLLEYIPHLHVVNALQ